MKSKNPYSEKLDEFKDIAFHLTKLKKDSFQKRGFVKKVLEIGCSNAHFLSTIANENPSTFFIGLDWKYKVLYKGAKRVEALGLKNIALVRGVAEKLIDHFDIETFDEIWIFFPDPWAKKSQVKNRLFKESFLAELSTSLKTGGRVYFKTDHPGYYRWCLKLFGKEVELDHDLYENHAPTSDVKNPGYRNKQIRLRKSEDVLPEESLLLQKVYAVTELSDDYWKTHSNHPSLFTHHQTLFEKGFVKDGLPIYYLELQKN